MGLIWRIGKLVLMAIAAILFVTLSVANRHDVTLVLDPFKPENPVFSLTLPFFAYLFAALFFGIVLGGMASWFSQGKWRKTARQRTREAYKWKQEADRLTQERDVNTRPGLPAA
ncbi:MAG: hypothetical protein ACR2OX_12080 [Methyloligellaceae bacterium]